MSSRLFHREHLYSKVRIITLGRGPLSLQVLSIFRVWWSSSRFSPTIFSIPLGFSLLRSSRSPSIRAAGSSFLLFSLHSGTIFDRTSKHFPRDASQVHHLTAPSFPNWLKFSAFKSNECDGQRYPPRILIFGSSSGAHSRVILWVDHRRSREHGTWNMEHNGRRGVCKGNTPPRRSRLIGERFDQETWIEWTSMFHRRSSNL